MKRKGLMVVSCIFAIITGLAIFAACGGGQEEKQSGPEAGTYYCDYEGQEQSLVLAEKCVFELKIGTTVMNGDYTLENESLTLAVKDGAEIPAVYRNDTVTLTYASVQYVFLRKTEYTVRFQTDGGSTIEDVTVVNGRTLTRPADPEKAENVFVGWYSDSTFHNPFYFSQPITENKTLYARFVAEIDPEFVVKFDVGTQGVAPAPVSTAGHKAYLDFVETPEKDGAEFLGWYYSDFESADKLTAAFTEDTIVTQNMTLFAVWKSDAPVVSVSKRGVSISAQGTNLSYDLKITAPDHSEFTYSAALATGATTEYAYDFSELAEGEYKIEVDVGNKTTTRYFNNKALARVSVFKIDGATLYFNAVEHATEYTVSVECGTPGHSHVDISRGDKTYYDFAQCDMREEGIIFTVKAKADGFVTSVSEPYTYINRLAAVSDMTLDETTGVVSWSAVPHATAYRVTALVGGSTVVDGEEVAEPDFSVRTFGKGAVELRIVPIAFGWNSPAAAVYNFEKASLAAPQNVRFSGGSVLWDAVQGATGGYEVHIGEKTVKVTATTYALAATDFGSADETEICVYALGATDAETSYASDAITITSANEVRELAYANGALTWDAVLDATSYEVKIGENGTVRTVTVPTAKITFQAAGEQTLYVRAITSSAPSQWAHVTVTVYSVQYNVGTAEIDTPATVFLAEGDPIELPAPEWTGYDFIGWYRAPGGDLGEAPKYTNKVFDGGNLTLYAYFTPRVFTITLVAGEEGEWMEKTYEVYYRQSDFALPVPDPASSEYTFRGWYRGIGGTGAMFADATGGNTGTYTMLKDLTLYAKWITPFTYKEVQGGYSISAGPNIGTTTYVKIPAMHNGRPIVTVEDLTAGTKLEVIDIPNTVKTISLGSIGKAFSGLTKLREVNIYAVEGNRDPVYASQGGMVYEIEGNRLVFVPIAVGENVTLPSNIETIVMGAIFNNESIVNLTIPASVKNVQAEAISGDDYNETLEKITFVASSAADASLVVNGGAFYALDALTTIEFPAYVAEIVPAATEDADATWEECENIANIKIVGTDGKEVTDSSDGYFSVDGVLCRTGTIDGRPNTKELFYYAPGRGAASYTPPAGITVIGANAFYQQGHLSSITIPAAITHIGESAFYYASKITEITFEADGNSNDLSIDDHAFERTKPTELTIPANVVKVGFRAFYTQTLTKITLLGKENMSAVDYSKSAFGTAARTDSELVLGANFPVIDLAAVFSTQANASSAPTPSSINKVTIDKDNHNYLQEDADENGIGGTVYSADKKQLLYLGNREYKDFVIPDGVTAVSPWLFRGQESLVSVTIPASLTEIPEYTFYGCYELKTVTFKEPADDAERAHLTIGAYAFRNCYYLTNFTLPRGTDEIGDFAFAGCENITELTIPGTVRRIGTQAFDMQNSESPHGLHSLTIEEGVEEIGTWAFFRCTELTSVTIPSTVHTIGARIFGDCDALETITIDERNQYFASIDGAFYKKELRPGTTNVYDPVTLVLVPRSATGDANNTLNVPATVTTVESYAMELNSGIKYVKFADKVIAYDEQGNQVDGTLTIGGTAFSGATALETVHLPAGTISIGASAFADCGALKTVNIPYTVAEIKSKAFSNCKGITNGLTFDATPDGTEKVNLVFAGNVFAGMASLTEIALPERTTEIASSTFNNKMTALRKVTLPSTLDMIVSEAFSGLTKLQEVVLPERVAAGYEIQEEAFSGCVALTKIGTPKQVALDPTKPNEKTEVYFLPEGIARIGNGAFDSCGLTTIGLPASFTIPDANYSAVFTNCAALETIVFEGGGELDVLPGGFVTGATALKHVVFGEDMKLTTLGGAFGTNTSDEGIFEGALELESIAIPASVETIKSYAFANLRGLKNVTFAGDSNLALMQSYAFLNAGFTSFTFPNVTDEEGGYKQLVVEGNLFFGCADLATINLSASVWDVTGLFVGCPALSTITADPNSKAILVDAASKTVYGIDEAGHYDTILHVYGELTGTLEVPDGTIEISTYAYKGQTGITEVVLPASVVKIGAGAFENCLNLTTVRFKDNAGAVGALSLIDDAAFKNCWKLGAFDFPTARNLSYIGSEAFYGCAFTKLDLGKNNLMNSSAAGSTLKGIAARAFACNDKLGTELLDPNAAEQDKTSVRLPSVLETLGYSAFAGNTALVYVDLSNTALTKLETEEATTDRYGTPSVDDKGMFYGCTSLKSVKLPASITSIGRQTFYNTALETINFDGLTALNEVGNHAFANTKLRKVDLSNNTSLKSLGRNMFQGCAELKEAALPAGLLTIETYVFDQCVLLDTINLPSTLTNIGDGAFRGCIALTKVVFPESLEEIGTTKEGNPVGAFRDSGITAADLSATQVSMIRERAFSGAKSLASVTFPETLNTISPEAFRDTIIEKVVLPASYTYFDDEAFYRCRKLSSVTYEAEEVEIGYSAFEGCESLATFDFSRVVAIYDAAFADTGFTELTVPAVEGLDYSYDIFSDCRNLISVTLSEGVTELGEEMFMYCENLQTVTILDPEFTSIADSVFENCRSLSTINWPSSISNLKSIGSNAFDTTAIKTLDLSGASSKFTTIERNAFADCTQLTSITLPASVSHIQRNAFNGCTSLTTVENMDNVEVIDDGAFGETGFTTFRIGSELSYIGEEDYMYINAFVGAQDLAKFEVAPDNENFTVGENGELYAISESEKILVCYPLTAQTFGLAEDTTGIGGNALQGYSAPDATLTLPASIEYIGEGSPFTGLTIKKLVVPATVTELETYAFAYCNIEEIELQVKAKTLEGYSALFSQNPVLTKVTLPDGVTKLDSGWFSGCKAITSFEIPASVTELGDTVFYGTGLTSINIPETVTTIGANVFAETGITSLTVPETVTTLKDSAFKGMYKLEEVTFNAEITSNVKQVFEGDTSTGSNHKDSALRTITFGDKITTIGDNWFNAVPTLTTVNLTNATALTTIGANAFAGTGITSISLPDTVTSIGASAFANSALQTLTLPSGVTAVPQNMCQGCTALEWVKLGDDVTSIGANAFGGCTALKFVNLPSKVTSVSSCFEGATNVHVFVPRTWAAFSGTWWYPAENNHLYFEASLYETVVSRDLTWLSGRSLAGVSFGATYEQALKASGATNFPGYPQG